MSLIIFDFDGTIADSFEYVYDFLSREAGKRKPADADIEVYRHKSMKTMALGLGIPFWRLPYVYFKGRRRLRHHILNLRPFQGMPEVLRDLHNQGHTLAIVSSNSGRNIRRFLKIQELQPYIRSVKGGAGILAKVTLFRQLQRRFKAQADTWCVCDELTDIASAKAVGAKSLAVAWGFASPEELERYEPTAIVRQAADISAIINGEGLLQ